MLQGSTKAAATLSPYYRVHTSSTPSIDASTEAEEGVATEQRTTVRVVIWVRELFRGSENGIGHVFGTTDNDLL